MAQLPGSPRAAFGTARAAAVEQASCVADAASSVDGKSVGSRSPRQLRVGTAVVDACGRLAASAGERAAAASLLADAAYMTQAVCASGGGSTTQHSAGTRANGVGRRRAAYALRDAVSGGSCGGDVVRAAAASLLSEASPRGSSSRQQRPTGAGPRMGVHVRMGGSELPASAALSATAAPSCSLGDSALDPSLEGFDATR